MDDMKQLSKEIHAVGAILFITNAIMWVLTLLILNTSAKRDVENGKQIEKLSKQVEALKSPKTSATSTKE